MQKNDQDLTKLSCLVLNIFTLSSSYRYSLLSLLVGIGILSYKRVPMVLRNDVSRVFYSQSWKTSVLSNYKLKVPFIEMKFFDINFEIILKAQSDIKVLRSCYCTISCLS